MSKQSGTWSSHASESENSEFETYSNSSVSSIEEDINTNGHHKENGVACVEQKPSAFVVKLFEIPMFADTVDYVKQTKYGGLGVQMTVSAVNNVSNLTRPVSEKFQGPISKADEFAANSVKYLCETIPIVQTPTCDIVNKVKQPALDTITTVKQYQETFGSTLDEHCLTPARNIATSVGSQLDHHVTAPSIAMAKKVDASLVGVVDKLQNAVQTWLPEEGSTDKPTIKDGQDNGDLSQTLRAFTIAIEGQQRLRRSVLRQINNTHTYTSGQLRQLQKSNQLLKNATDTVAHLNQTLLGIVVNVRDTVQNPDIGVTFHTRLHELTTMILGDLNKAEDLPKAVQNRVIELSHALLSTTDSISQYIKQNAKNFPDILQVRLSPLVTFFEKRYTDVVNEIKNGEGSPMEKARNIVMLTTQHTLPLLHSSLNDLQESIHCYRTSFETSISNTTERVRATVGIKS